MRPALHRLSIEGNHHEPRIASRIAGLRWPAGRVLRRDPALVAHPVYQPGYDVVISAAAGLLRGSPAAAATLGGTPRRALLRGRVERRILGLPGSAGSGSRATLGAAASGICLRGSALLQRGRVALHRPHWARQGSVSVAPPPPPSTAVREPWPRRRLPARTPRQRAPTATRLWTPGQRAPAARPVYGRPGNVPPPPPAYGGRPVATPPPPPAYGGYPSGTTPPPPASVDAPWEPRLLRRPPTVDAPWEPRLLRRLPLRWTRGYHTLPAAAGVRGRPGTPPPPPAAPAPMRPSLPPGGVYGGGPGSPPPPPAPGPHGTASDHASARVR